jgi:NADPH:quinone reductase-like Zn-dependent oxidoreductase
MHRVTIRKPGGLKRLELETVPEPLPVAGQVRVATRAVGVNFADCVVRLGLYPSARDYVGWPFTPGFEFSGIISAVGAGVERLKVGDRVFGVTRFGAYASEVVVGEQLVKPLPDELDFEQAAAFPTVFLTAWYAVRELVRLRPGMNVLVHSAAGGVGCALIQLCKAAGARVVGVVGAEHKRDTALEQGADGVIVKSREALWPAAERLCPDGYHVVLDANGAETLRQSYAHLRPTGRLVVYGFHTMLSRGSDRPNWFKVAWDFLRTPRFSPLAMTDANKCVLAFNLSYLFDQMPLYHEAMDELLAQLKAGRLRPLPVQTLPFDQVREAHRLLHGGATVGKLVLTLS